MCSSLVTHGLDNISDLIHLYYTFSFQKLKQL